MKIICKNCGWSWNRNDGGANPCKCHKCGYNNMYGKKIVGLGGVTKVKPTSKHAEWIILNRLFGTEMMKFYFNDFKGYESTRKEGASYQDVYDELIIV